MYFDPLLPLLQLLPYFLRYSPNFIFFLSLNTKAKTKLTKQTRQKNSNMK